MKHVKKIIAVICLTAMMTCCFSFSASALVFMDGDFGFELNTYTKEATLVKYDGSDSTVTIPGSYSDYHVTKLGNRALSGNSVMQVLNLPTTMYKIESRALNGCSALSAVRFPTYITSLGEEVCLNCTSLQTAYVYASIDTLPAYSFAGCTSLTTVDLNQSIKSISAYAFQDCISLKDLSFLTKITSIDKNAFEGTGISELTIPESITEIPDYAFANCTALTEVTILNHVTYISPTAFLNDPVMIKCYYDSYAYQYAIENHIPYTLLDNVLLGDANGDGSVNINDVTQIQRHLAELESLEGIYLHAADANQDGTLDISDATTLQMYLAKYDIPYPIGEVMTQ